MAGGSEDLWRNFPKTAIEFERTFATVNAEAKLHRWPGAIMHQS